MLMKWMARETHMNEMRKLIGTDFNFYEALRAIDAEPEQKALRERNAARLAALKDSMRLVEDRTVDAGKDK